MNEYTVTLATLMDHLLDITIDVANGNVGAVAAKSEALIGMAWRLEQSARRWQREANGQGAMNTPDSYKRARGALAHTTARDDDELSERVRVWFIEACESLGIEIDDMPHGNCPVQARGTWGDTDWYFRARSDTSLTLTDAAGHDRIVEIDYGVEVPNESRRTWAAEADRATEAGAMIYQWYGNATTCEPYPGWMSKTEALICIAVGFGMLAQEADDARP